MNGLRLPIQRDRKYHNTPVIYKNKKYDSLAEFARFVDLERFQELGIISNLTVHKKFDVTDRFEVDGFTVGARYYVADFTYTDRDGQFVIEDVKGFLTHEYLLKYSVLQNRFGYVIYEYPAKLILDATAGIVHIDPKRMQETSEKSARMLRMTFDQRYAVDKLGYVRFNDRKRAREIIEKKREK